MPTHSYLRASYKYPQAAFPYQKLRDENRRRGLSEPEYELTDAGGFDGDRYWDVTAEYAKASPDDILIRITVVNRGPAAARVHLLPTVWFRNTWSWGSAYDEGRWAKPTLTKTEGGVAAEAPRRLRRRRQGFADTSKLSTEPGLPSRSCRGRVPRPGRPLPIRSPASTDPSSTGRRAAPPAVAPPFCCGVPSAMRCCCPLCWKRACQFLPRRKIRTRSPTLQ